MKTAFVLSGGGARGAFQVGALNYLVSEKGIQPDIITGVSTGALQALALAQQDMKVLCDVWLGIQSYRDIFSKSLWNYLKVLVGSSNGIYRFTGLQNILMRVFDRAKLLASPSELYVGTVDLQTATMSYIDKQHVMINDILASCSIPIVFPPVSGLYSQPDYQFVDGGVRDIVPLRKAILAGADRIFVILCSPQTLPILKKPAKTIVDVALRTSEILLNEIYRNDIRQAQRVNKNLKILGDYDGHREIEIRVVEPETPVCDTLEFSHETIVRAMERGYDRARLALEGIA